jgi:undecaprenyl-diphosphatase
VGGVVKSAAVQQGAKRRAIGSGVALSALSASYILAVQRPVPEWELELTAWCNGAPDAVAMALYPVMQLGTVWAPIGVGIAIGIARRDHRLALVTVGAGLATWFAAKGVKQVVERGRPLVYLPEIHVREGSGAGLGFISGHSAVAAVCATIAAAVMPRRLRWIPALLAGTVGIARIVHGVHLPADVVGGWAFGAVIGFATLELVERWSGDPA